MISLGHGSVVPNDELNAELVAIREQMSRLLSREQIVANELCAYIDLETPIEQWTRRSECLMSTESNGSMVTPAVRGKQ